MIVTSVKEVTSLALTDEELRKECARIAAAEFLSALFITRQQPYEHCADPKSRRRSEIASWLEASMDTGISRRCWEDTLKKESTLSISSHGNRDGLVENHFCDCDECATHEALGL